MSHYIVPEDLVPRPKIEDETETGQAGLKFDCECSSLKQRPEY